MACEDVKGGAWCLRNAGSGVSFPFFAGIGSAVACRHIPCLGCVDICNMGISLPCATELDIVPVDLALVLCEK